MTSKGTKRGRKEQVEDEAPAKDSADEVEEAGSDEPSAKRGRGRPRKPEHLKKKWVSSGRPRGRPRIHEVDPNKPKRPKGRPRVNLADENGSPKSKKGVNQVKKRGRPKKN